MLFNGLVVFFTYISLAFICDYILYYTYSIRMFESAFYYLYSCMKIEHWNGRVLQLVRIEAQMHIEIHGLS